MTGGRGAVRASRWLLNASAFCFVLGVLAVVLAALASFGVDLGQEAGRLWAAAGLWLAGAFVFRVLASVANAWGLRRVPDPDGLDLGALMADDRGWEDRYAHPQDSAPVDGMDWAEQDRITRRAHRRGDV